MNRDGSFRTIQLSDPTFETGGLRYMTVKSAHLSGRADICLYVPESIDDAGSTPIYILLHGVYSSAWAWALMGGAHVVAKRLIEGNQISPAIIAMPSDGLWGDGSAYWKHHDKLFDQWIVHDVPLAIRENIPGADPDSPVCIGGLSMGGYGALQLGINHASKFKAVSAHSAIIFPDDFKVFVEESISEYDDMGKLPSIIDCLREKESAHPPIRFDCGNDDPLIESNRRLHQFMMAENLQHTYQEFSGGHEWGYWHLHLEKSLLFFDQHAV